MNTFSPDQKILALSWKEPYGTLMLYGKIETRTWHTNYRGWVLICCSKKSYDGLQVLQISGREQTDRIVFIMGYLPKVSPGKAIAIGRLIDCRPMTLEDENACFVKYRPGLWCHVYEDIQPIVKIPWKGQLKWKELDLLQKEGLTILK